MSTLLVKREAGTLTKDIISRTLNLGKVLRSGPTVKSTQEIIRIMKEMGMVCCMNVLKGNESIWYIRGILRMV